MFVAGLKHILKNSVTFSFLKTIAEFHRGFDRQYVSKTIYSLSSGSGKCAVAVIRISGPRSQDALKKMCEKFPKKRLASLCKIYHPTSTELLDKALVLWFPGPQSFTGEDCAEFHVHGGPAVVSSVLEALSSVADLHPAQPGEFTKQAFLNGKLDLTEVEGLGDLIHAETEAQRKQALRQMSGDLGNLYEGWRSRLLKCLANTEAYIDFHEEENIEEDILDHVSAEVSALQFEIDKHLNDSRKGERLRDGLSVVIAGEPNVGKSSLLNTICQRPAAIVSPIAGTTRDVVETALNIAGYPVLFSDTAGLRETSDLVEKEGVSRAKDRLSSADLTIMVIDASKVKEIIDTESSLSNFVAKHMEGIGLGKETTCTSDSTEIDHVNSSMFQPTISNTLVVFNKADLMKSGTLHDSLRKQSQNVCSVSCLTGQGFDDFMTKLVHIVKKMCGDPLQGNPSLTQSRHRHHLSKCCFHLGHFANLLNSDLVLAAEKLRLAAEDLGHVTGIMSAEDVLDVIFRDFCIGK